MPTCPSASPPESSMRDIPLAERYGAAVARWVVRLVLHVHSFWEFHHLLPNRNKFFRELGRESLADSDVGEQAVFDFLQGVATRLDRKKDEASRPLSRNFLRLATVLNLSQGDQLLLRFAMALEEVSVLRQITEMMDGGLVTRAPHDTLAHVLEMSAADVRRGLHRDGPLTQAGVLGLHPYGSGLSTKLDLLDGLTDALLDDEADLFVLFRAYFRLAPPPRLTLANYPHLREDLALVRRCVTAAAKGQAPGINLLLYGRPGTGKTEFVRALAADLGLSLYEVSSEHEKSESEQEDQRFRAYQLCQRVLAHAPTSLILFDEIEDVFPASIGWGWRTVSRTGTHKAWTNHLLETNPIPTIWLSNSISQIDPAFLRRFTYSLEVRTPPRSVRRRIVEQCAQGLPVSVAWIERVAKHEQLAPAQIEQACRLARAVETREGPEAEQIVERVLSRSLEVLGHPGGLSPQRDEVAPPYRLQFLNPSLDLEVVTQGLLRLPQGRLCLYGPPGSGKTAYARYLAERLDRPLLSRRASDLLSKWVGETEANLAEMFRQARADEAILLLDEADSFLQDRRGALRSWEITQVNELLVQMEAFDSLFLCSTNLMDSLDPAVLRRFDLKIRFGYLRPEQAWELVRETLDRHGCTGPSPERAAVYRHRLAALTTLAPGDVATVLRRAQVLGLTLTADWVLAALEEECKVKLQGRTPVMGFTR